MAEAGRTQTYRQVAIGSALGDDFLLFRRATIIEHLGRMFHMEVDVFTDKGEVDFKKIVGTGVTIRLAHEGGTRFFHGFVTRIIHTGGSERVAHYRLTLSPWLWFLTRVSDCRFFQKMKVPDIIKQVLSKRGFDDIDTDRLKGHYPVREYCVQYRETDFNFVSRLMEEEGIYYFFTHEDNKHTMVLADSSSSHEAYEGCEIIPFFPPTEADRGQEYVWDWQKEQEVQPGKYSLRDYNFETPGEDLSANATFPRDYAVPNFEMFDCHPARYKTSADGDALSKVRLEEHQAYYEVIRATGDVRCTSCGCTFTLDGLNEEQDKEHLITSVVHQIESDEYSSSADGDSAAPVYESTFTAILATQQYRPKRVTPKPMIQGPQTAFVVGPEGEEIHTDKYGRIKVQFHWMRVSDNEDDEEDEKGSCWIRVAQPWAGKSWGTVFLPRIGQEVVVSFLEGDPDQPLITGAVYNAEAMPPYALPDNKTRSCIKTDSSKGGGGFNEIRFEDKKGSEELFIHAEKNLNMHIKNNVYEQVNNEVHITIDKKKSETVKEDREETVVKCHTESIGKTRSLTIGENEAKSVGGTHSFTVTKDVKEKFDANHAETVKEEYYLKAKDIIIEGTDSITIKVKNNFIAIDSSGISVGADQPNGTVEVKSKGDTTVKSTMGLTMEATAAAGLKGTASLTLESPAATTVKGAMVKIN